MYDALLVRHCAPTLAGLKTGALFSCPFPCPEDMRACLRRWNVLLYAAGLHVLPLGSRTGRTLVYVYRSRALLRDLGAEQAKPLLLERHYPIPSPERCIAHLIRRLTDTAAFPHEIGLFLGYPPEDVRGFIRDPTVCKYSGCWKVYGDVNAARSLFEAYRRCTHSCCAQLALGARLDRLIKAQ